VYDNSMLADDAARARDRERRKGRFARALENMKIPVEGGTVSRSQDADCMFGAEFFAWSRTRTLDHHLPCPHSTSYRV
jgi:hypothetical protein